MTGTRNGRLVVLSRAGQSLKCICDCGVTKTVRLGNLPRTRSCGCLRSELVAEKNRLNARHGHGRDMTPTYRTWLAMRRRCQSPNVASYPLYGGRGIAVCERWQSFENFLADMGERPPRKTIDRIDGNGDYEPGNCRWATSVEQNNNRSNSRRVTIGGETMTAAQWARTVGITRNCLSLRLRRGIRGRALLRPSQSSSISDAGVLR